MLYEATQKKKANKDFPHTLIFLITHTQSGYFDCDDSDSMSDMDMSYMDEFEATNFMLMEDNATMYDDDIIEASNNQYYQQPPQHHQQQYHSTITVDSSNPINYYDDNEEQKYEYDADNDELIKNNSYCNNERSLPENVECSTTDIAKKSDKNVDDDDKKSETTTTHKQLIA